MSTRTDEILTLFEARKRLHLDDAAVAELKMAGLGTATLGSHEYVLGSDLELALERIRNAQAEAEGTGE